ncbi:MAG: HAMP domain-containing sensor histidine kinase [Candidatus Omnitrophota bacterium]
MQNKKKTQSALILSLCLTTIIPILVVIYLIKPKIIYEFEFNPATFLIISITAFIVFMGMFMLLKISNSLSVLSKNATRLAQGDLAVNNSIVITPTLKQSTEVSGLAESLNLITEQLIFNVDELESKAILLERSNDVLEKLNQRKNEFVSMVTHELRAPLINIKQCVVMLLEGKIGQLSSDQKQSMLMIKSNSERLIRLIADILDVTKLDSTQLQVVPVNLKKAVEESAEAVRHWCESKGITINIRNIPKTTVIYGDIDRIHQIFINLFSNAIKYSHPRGVITINSNFNKEQTKGPMQRQFVDIEIKDNGIGIAPEDLGKIFERFVKVEHSAYTRTSESTGLGLAIVKEIVEMHGGKINVESKLGKGSMFTLSLPLSMRKDQDSQAAA